MNVLGDKRYFELVCAFGTVKFLLLKLKIATRKYG